MTFGAFAALLSGEDRFFICGRGILVNLDSGLDWLRFVTPYYYADAARVFAGEVPVGCVLAGCGLGALGAGFGLWQYRRKDIA